MTTTAPEPLGYPTTWREFVGQAIAVKQIRTAAKSAKIRKKPADHILLSHPDGGVGKTALLHLAGREMGTNVVEVTGCIQVGTARRIIGGMSDRDVLIWDEFHRSVEGGKKNALWLLHFLQDGVLLGPFGKEPMPAITILAATTELQLLPPVIVGRFSRPPMVGYTLAEAAKIVLVQASKILVPEGLPAPSKANAVALAACAGHNPRAIGKLLVLLRDIAVTSKDRAHDGKGYDLTEVFETAGLSHDGLDFRALEYLRVLLQADGELGERTLAAHLQEPSLTDVETVLVSKGYVGKTRTGRVLTAAGLARARNLAA
jgi:Holliday junction resolvasome RuvABC ATP-dependent DNA helicase subunit